MNYPHFGYLRIAQCFSARPWHHKRPFMVDIKKTLHLKRKLFLQIKILSIFQTFYQTSNLSSHTHTDTYYTHTQYMLALTPMKIFLGPSIDSYIYLYIYIYGLVATIHMYTRTSNPMCQHNDLTIFHITKTKKEKCSSAIENSNTVYRF